MVVKSDPQGEYQPSPGEKVDTYSVYKYDEVPENKSWASTIPTEKGLYNPEYEKDNCGVGMYSIFSPLNFFFQNY